MSRSSYQPSDIEKQIFKAAAERRLATGIARKQWCITMDEAALSTCHTLFESWVQVFGKEGAIDRLLEALAEEHHLLRARLQFEAEVRSGKRPTYTKVSSPRISGNVDGSDEDDGDAE